MPIQYAISNCIFCINIQLCRIFMYKLFPVGDADPASRLWVDCPISQRCGRPNLPAASETTTLSGEFAHRKNVILNVVKDLTARFFAYAQNDVFFPVRIRRTATIAFHFNARDAESASPTDLYCNISSDGILPGNPWWPAAGGCRTFARGCPARR